MNRAATREKVATVNLSAWCRKHGVNYFTARGLLFSNKRPLMTMGQVQVIEALRADGLLVEDDIEDAA